LPHGSVPDRSSLRPSDPTRGIRAGRVLVAVAASTFLVLVTPVVIRGGPLRDDFDLCVNPRWTSGLARAVDEILPETGAVRLPGRLAQVGLIAGTCGHVPFSFLILVPLILTLGVAFLLFLLLVDLGLEAPWPHIAVAVWLLQPLGTEASLWAAQFIVPIALLLSLAALLAYRKDRMVLGAIATVVAYGFLEHMIFAVPILTLLIVPRSLRRRAVAVPGTISLLVIATYLVWPGASSRTAVGLADRVIAIGTDPAWYVRFPAIGVGAHSIPVAVWWGLPLSLTVLAIGAAVGALAGPRLLGESEEPRKRGRGIGATVAGTGLILVFLNIPLMTTLPHPRSPRTFTPTWLVISAALAMIGSQVRWRRPRIAGGSAGFLAAGAALSIALSVNVRVRTADFTEAASFWLAERVPESGLVAVCHVPRTAVVPAPAGDFAVHEFIEPWSAEAALHYYTGRTAQIVRIGELDDPGCDPPEAADLVVDFASLPARPGGE
jgi:hypothetical protein